VPTYRPFNPVRRVLSIAITVSVVFTLTGLGMGRTMPQSVLAFVATFALALGAGCLMYRHDLAALIRARSED